MTPGDGRFDGSADGGPAAARWSLAVTSALLVLPLAWATLWLHGDRWAPAFDFALIELRVRDVGGPHTPLVGLGGRLGAWPEVGSHPGPLGFYALALPYRLLGSTYWALRASVAGLAALALIGSLLIARRSFGGRGLVVVAVCAAVLCHGLGLRALTLPWNPYLPLAWYFAFLLLVAAVLGGSERLLPVAAAVGSACAQTHVSYLPVCAALSTVALAVVGVRWWRAWRNGEPSRRHVVAVAVSLVVALVAWLPPAVQQLSQPRGNLTILYEHFTNPAAENFGVRWGLTLQLLAVDAWALELVRVFAPSVPFAPSVARGALWLAIWLGSFASTRVRPATGIVPLHATAAAAMLVGAAAASRITGPLVPHVVLFLAGGGTLAVAATVATFVALASGRRVALGVRRAAQGASLTVVVAASLRLASRVEESAGEHPTPSANVAMLVPDVVRALASTRSDPDAIVLLTREDALMAGEVFGLLVELERRGLRARLADDRFNRALVGAHRVAHFGDATLRLHVVNGGWIDDFDRTPGAARVAVADSRTPRERAERSAAIAEVQDALRRAGRADAVPLVTRDLGAARSAAGAVVPAAATRRIEHLGFPTAVFALRPLPRATEHRLVERSFTPRPPSAACAPAPTESCSLDRVDAGAAGPVNAVRRSGAVRLEGWATDAASGAVPSVVVLQLRGDVDYSVPADRSLLRPDAAIPAGSTVPQDAGFAVLATMGDVEPGVYDVTVLQIGARGNVLRCATGAEVRVE